MGGRESTGDSPHLPATLLEAQEPLLLLFFSLLSGLGVFADAECGPESVTLTHVHC